jgi:hypothetical protein
MIFGRQLASTAARKKNKIRKRRKENLKKITAKKRKFLRKRIHKNLLFLEIMIA